MIEIQTNGQTLDLPNNFSIDIEDSNPVFNDRGSQSIPVTVPASARNTRILDFPTRPDAAVNPNNPERAVTVFNGPYHRRGTMNITSAGRSEGITFNIGFDNSTAYSIWKQKKLNELENLPTYTPEEDGRQGGYPIDWLLDDLYYLYKSSRPQTDDLAVFPLAVNIESVNEDNLEREYCEILNVPGSHGLSQPGNVYRLIDGERTRVTIPEGYCVSPFVRVWRVLELVFNGLGFSMESNPFKDDLELARIVVLNNAADAVCRGTVRYADLMPDCTIEDFLWALWVRFGLIYNIDFDRRTVKLSLIRDIIAKSSRAAVDGNTAGLPLITYLNPQYIKLSAKTSIQGASPAADRFEDFTRGLDVADVHLVADINRWQLPSPETAQEQNAGNMLAREFITGMWYHLDSLNGKVRQSSSSFFDWDPKTPGMDALDLSSEDEFVPIRHVSNAGTDTGNGFSGYCPTYLFGARHYHSYIKGSDTADTGDTTPLAFMFAYTSGSKTIGRINPEGEDGKRILLDDGTRPTISLLFQFSDGLFANFWTGYDEILRHGARSIEVDAVFNPGQLTSLDMLEPITLNGVRCLIDKLNYSLPASGSVPVVMSLRTIQTQGDYNIKEEQNIPHFSAALRHLEWRLKAETYGPGLDTLQTRQAACIRYINDSGYTPHGQPGDYYSVTAEGAVYTGIDRLPPVWETDKTLPQPQQEGQTFTKMYRARIFYDILEIHDMTRQDGPDDWELEEFAIGTSYADVEYLVKLVAVWVSE